MYPTLFQIGSLSFQTHGLLAVLGIFLATVGLRWLAKKQGLRADYLFDEIIYASIAGIIGARITYFFLYREQFDSLGEIFYLWNGGMVSWGGFILGGVVLSIFFRRRKDSLKWLDLSAMVFPLGLIFGRLGNLAAGEYAGIAATHWFNISGQVPLPILEIMLLILVTCVLSFLYTRFRTKLSEGVLFCALWIMYGTGRSVIDVWRADSKILFGLSVGQITSLIVALIFLFLIFQLRKKANGQTIFRTTKTIIA